MTPEEIQIFLKAFDVYGPEHQIIKLFEEMSELQKPLCKWLGEGYDYPRRDLDSEALRDNICEEIADVSILLDQMLLLFNFDAKVDGYRFEKVERLAERLADVPMMEGL